MIQLIIRIPLILIGLSISLAAVQKYEAVLDLNPIGYWPANDGSGSILKDLSPTKNHAKLHNLSWKGSLLNFRSNFQWAEIPAHEIYQSRDFSMGGWVFLRKPVQGGFSNKFKNRQGMTFFGNGYHTSSYRLNTLHSDEVLLKKSEWGGRGGPPHGVSLLIRRSETVEVLSSGLQNALKTRNEVNLLPIGEWQHILYTFKSGSELGGDAGWKDIQDSDRTYASGTGRLYINGKLIKTHKLIPYKPRLESFIIGADARWWMQAVYPGSLDGSVRELVLFDKSLSQNDVVSLYENTRPQEIPESYRKGGILINNEYLDHTNLDTLPESDVWKVLKQMHNLGKSELEPYATWLKSRKEFDAVVHLLTLGEDDFVKQKISGWISILKDSSHNDEQRANAVLSILAAKDISNKRAIATIIAELEKLEKTFPRVEDIYKNALIYAVSEIDPDHKALQALHQGEGQPLFSQGDPMRDSRPEIANHRAYTQSLVYKGVTYRTGSGNAFDGTEAISAEEFEAIAKQEESKYPGIRIWAKGRKCARVFISKTFADGTVEKIYPLGKNFIFDQFDRKMKGWSFAVDKSGYIHLLGGLHDLMDEERYMPGTWEKWGMSRDFQDDKYPTTPYWRSTEPGNFESFEFLGFRDSADNFPVTVGFNYMNFVQDRNGELYLYGRVYGQGIQSWGFFKYDDNTKQWASIGGYAPDVKKEFPVWSDRFIKMAAGWIALPSIRWKHNHEHSKLFAWARQPHFYNFIRGWGFRWDVNNRLNIQIPLFALDDDNQLKDAMLYAYSDDGGMTFHAANGDKLELPITANSGKGNAEISNNKNIMHYNFWVRALNIIGCTTEAPQELLWDSKIWNQ